MHLCSIRTGLIVVAAMVAAAPSPAPAAPDASELCASAKLVAAATYAACTLRAEARLARTADVGRWQDAVAACAGRLRARYERAEAQFGGACPTFDDAPASAALLAQCTGDVATAVSGGGYPPTPTPSASPTPTMVPTPSPYFPTPTVNGRLFAYSGIEFSATQGGNNWYYGTYPDAPASFAFAPMTDFEPGTDGGSGRWWASRETSWASIWFNGQKPAGETSSCGKTATGDWAVRRWISTTYGLMRIFGLTGMQESGSDGAAVHVIVDGEIVFTRLVQGDDPDTPYEVFAPVSIGSTVDFAVSANGSDCGDAVLLSAFIEGAGG